MLHPSDQDGIDLHAQESPYMLYPQALKIPHAAPNPAPHQKKKSEMQQHLHTHELNDKMTYLL